MGRSSHSWLPNSFMTVPLGIARSEAAATNISPQTACSHPFGNLNAGVRSFDRQGFKCGTLQGLMWCMESYDIANISVRLKNKYNNPQLSHLSQDDLDIPFGGGGIKSGHYPMRRWASESTDLATNHVTGAGASITFPRFDADGTGQATGAAMDAVLTPHRIYLQDGTTAAVPTRAGQRWSGFPSQYGPTVGGLTTMRVAQIAGTTGTTLTNSTVRRITVPFGMRIHKVQFFHGGSAAGNTMKLTNNTTSLDITDHVSMVAATSEANEVTIGDSDFNGANRNVAAGAELDLVVTTGATGFGACGALITLHSTSLSDRQRVFIPQNEPASVAINHPRAARTLSGPATGGLACLYWPHRAVASGTDDTDVLNTTCIAPFDCEILWLVLAYRTAPSGSLTVTMRNATQGNDVHMALLATAQTMERDQADLTSPLITRGDVLNHNITTVAGTATEIWAMAVVQVQGFAQDDPGLD